MSRWIAHIYNPKTKRTHSRKFRSTASGMAEVRLALRDASRRFGVRDDYILAVPSREKILRRKRRSKHRRSR